jgi:predicted RNA-binding Zn-ribbon protein involved in translation (DUF1610 family)
MPAFTRAAFDRQRQLVKDVSRREGRVLVPVSVGLGIGQLVFLRWAEGRLEPETVTAIAGVAFLIYMGLVIWLIWRMDRRVRAVRPSCPQCGKRLQGLSERVAGATGRCDACGGQVIE